MFDWDEEENRWVAMHHLHHAPGRRPAEARPRRRPRRDPLDSRPAYDLVLNGFEAGGGTIRIHDSDVQNKVFGLLGMTRELAKEQFGFLVDALQFGAPPHGGLALGLDRVVMLFAGIDNIRDCIAFPKTTKASDLMTGAPSEVAPRQLEELAIKTTAVKEEPEEKE